MCELLIFESDVGDFVFLIASSSGGKFWRIFGKLISPISNLGWPDFQQKKGGNGHKNMTFYHKNVTTSPLDDDFPQGFPVTQCGGHCWLGVCWAQIFRLNSRAVPR